MTAVLALLPFSNLIWAQEAPVVEVTSTSAVVLESDYAQTDDSGLPEDVESTGDDEIFDDVTPSMAPLDIDLACYPNCPQEQPTMAPLEIDHVCSVAGGGSCDGEDAASTEADDIRQPLDSESSHEADVTSTEAVAANSDTGAESSNTSTVDVSHEVEVQNANSAKVYNDSLIHADTGNNIAGYNTGSGIITTQRARGFGELANLINRNSLDAFLLRPDQGSGMAANQDTGPGSENFSSANLNDRLTVKNINTAHVVNRIKANVNSGRNTSDNNTGHGIVVSGDAEIGLNVINLANSSITGADRFFMDWKNIHGNSSSSINIMQESVSGSSELTAAMRAALNSNTGAGSNNVSLVQSGNEISITNNNSGVLENDIEVRAVSGQNTSSGNTGSGSIATGNAKSAVNVLNLLNANIAGGNVWFKAINVFGDFSGDLVLPAMPRPNLALSDYAVGGHASSSAANSMTGSGSTDVSSVSSTQELEISNDNRALIANNVNVKANTGNNLTSYNGGSGSSRFGNSEAQTNEMNLANLNVTGDSWWTVAVNHFGPWSGTTIGSPAAVSVSSQGASVVITPQGSGLEVGSHDTGADSNNLSGYAIHNSTEVGNENQAKIINNLDVSAITGENEAQRNTGHGYIYAGDAMAVSNLVNFANVNMTAGNWLVAVINVFGKWTGNLVFADAAGANGSGSGAGGSTSGNASNSGTGAGSDNSAASNSNSSTTVANSNNADVSNSTDSSATSGGNSASYNTGAGVVSTGGADAGSSVGNNVNNNGTVVGGNGTSTSACSNSDTGAGSDNGCQSNSSSTSNVSNSNNATTTNSGSAGANSGGNSSNYNTGSGVVDTGWVSALVDLYNQNNTNQISVGQVLGDMGETDDDGTNEQDGDNGDDDSDGDENGNDDGNNQADAGNSGGGGGGGGTISGGSGTVYGSTNPFSSGVTTEQDFFTVSADQDATISKTFADGARVELYITKGTFASNVSIALAQLGLTKYSTPLPKYGASSHGKAIKITAMDKSGNEVSKLNKEIVVRFYGEGFAEGKSGAYHFDAKGPKWVRLASALGEGGAYLDSITNHFSVFAAFDTAGLASSMEVVRDEPVCQASPHYGDRNLLRDPQNGRIYVLASGKLKHVSNLQELDRYRSVPVYDVDQSVLKCYPVVDLISFRDRAYPNGVMLRSQDSGRIYQIVRGMKKYLSSIAEVKALGKMKMLNVAQGVIDAYPLVK